MNGSCTVNYAAICSRETVYLSASLYYFAFMNWYKYFPEDQFQIIHFPDFVENPAEVLRKVQVFLGLKEISLPPVAANISPKRNPMSQSTRNFLQKFYEPYNSLLYQLLNINFEWDQPRD